jgi:hypothetical protein
MSNVFFARGGQYNEIRFSNVNRIILRRCTDQNYCLVKYAFE